MTSITIPVTVMLAWGPTASAGRGDLFATGRSLPPPLLFSHVIRKKGFFATRLSPTIYPGEKNLFVIGKLLPSVGRVCLLLERGIRLLPAASSCLSLIIHCLVV